MTTKSSSAFVDSTVLFSASVSATGASRLVVDRGVSHQFDLIISTLVLRETEENLTDKRPSALPQFAIYRSGITKIVDPPVALVRLAMQVVAAKDAPIVAAAAHAGSDYLITLDQKHLLARRDEIEVAFGVVTLTPGEALARL